MLLLRATWTFSDLIIWPTWEWPWSRLRQWPETQPWGQLCWWWSHDHKIKWSAMNLSTFRGASSPIQCSYIQGKCGISLIYVHGVCISVFTASCSTPSRFTIKLGVETFVKTEHSSYKHMVKGHAPIRIYTKKINMTVWLHCLLISQTTNFRFR